MITIVKPSYSWPETTIRMLPVAAEHIERCGRICYKSEERITDDSADRFVRMIRNCGHESVLEHISLTAIIICSRSCSHQLVRHRIASYSQESQRFCNYGKSNSLQVICPPSIGLLPGDYQTFTPCVNRRQHRWLSLVWDTYTEYLAELEDGVLPEDARYVLPNATKTELATTFNLRQWRHVFEERALNKHAQWEIRGIFNGLLQDLKKNLPTVFEDLEG